MGGHCWLGRQGVKRIRWGSGVHRLRAPTPPLLTRPQPSHHPTPPPNSQTRTRTPEVLNPRHAQPKVLNSAALFSDHNRSFRAHSTIGPLCQRTIQTCTKRIVRLQTLRGPLVLKQGETTEKQAEGPKLDSGGVQSRTSTGERPRGAEKNQSAHAHTSGLGGTPLSRLYHKLSKFLARTMHCGAQHKGIKSMTRHHNGNRRKCTSEHVSGLGGAAFISSVPYSL